MDDANQPQQKPDISVSPVGQIQALPQKEQESVLVSSGAGSVEGIRPSEPEPVIHPELTKVGVEKVTEFPTLTIEQKKIGITLAKEAVPVSTIPTGTVQLPLTQQQAKKIVGFHKKVSESIVWLATLVLRQVKIMHQKVASS